MRPDPGRPRFSAVLSIIATLVLAGALITVGITHDAGGGDSITITVGKPKAPDSPRTEPTQIDVPRDAVDAAERTDVGDHDDLKTENPAGANRDELDDAREQQDRLAERDDLPVVTPLAAPSQRGCATRLVANRSSRRGVRPRLLVVHYTVSANRPGWSDVWAVVSLFDRPAFAASSTWVIDSEGHCAYIVRESDKPWTQAAANPVSLSTEMVNSGREGKLAADAGTRKLGRVFADAAKRWAIPIQPGAVSGCTVIRPGIIDHHALGACGGGHFDISPYPLAPVIAATRDAAGVTPASSTPSNVAAWCRRAAATTDQAANDRRLALVARRGYRCDDGVAERRHLTGADGVTCRKLQWWRRHGRPHGEPEANATRRRRALDSRGVICPASGKPRSRAD